MGREPFVTAIYKPELDATNQPEGNFADHVNAVTSKAKAERAKRKNRRKYGNFSSPGAQATPESNRLTRRICGEKDD